MAAVPPVALGPVGDDAVRFCGCEHAMLAAIKMTTPVR
jgi:hypothetical protein